MSFKFTPQQNLAAYVSGIGVYNHSSPASVFFQGKLFLFYLGSGGADIWYTTTSDGRDWAGIRKINDDAKNIGAADNTSPCAVVFRDSIYLFFNGKGNDGTWCTTFAGSKWSPAFSISSKVGGMGFLPSTSPSATVYDSNLYLFWNGAGDDGIFYTITSNGNNWTPSYLVNNVGIAKATSPHAVIFSGLLYLFWNGRGQNGTWYTALSNGSWKPQTQIKNIGFLPGTSPTTLVLSDNSLLRLLWVGSGGSDQGAWYADFDNKNWTAGKKMADDIGGQGLLPSTNPGTVFFGQTPWVFWIGYGQDIWFSYGKPT